MGLQLGAFQIDLPPFVTAWLKQQRDHLLFYEVKVRELDQDVKKLQEEKDKVKNKVIDEKNRYGKEIVAGVIRWLDGVDEIILVYEKFKNDEDQEYAGCSHGFLPKAGIRFCLSRTADDITRKVNKLLQGAPKPDSNLSYWGRPSSIDADFSNDDYEIFLSRDETMKEIMDALEDSSVRMIGVHGLSGVGKTTLVKEIAKRAQETNLVDVVMMANVTNNPDMRKIQGLIADKLGMKLEEESEIGRAARIRKRLMNVKENTLIILDDFWAKLDFNKLGIPFDDDNDGQKNLKEGKSPEASNMMKIEKYPSAIKTEKFLGKMKSKKIPGSSKIIETEKHHSAYHKITKKLPDSSNEMRIEKIPGDSNIRETEEPLGHHKGCKILLISESKQILLSQMDGKGNSISAVGVLEVEEAEVLFKKVAGIGDENSEFEELAGEIANKCNRLPLTIVTTARALKNKGRLVWKDVKGQLERQTLTKVPEFSTKLCYDLLENEELKYAFLLCARMGRDAFIMDMVKYCFGLDFLQGIYTIKEARNGVNSLLGQLKELSLLSYNHSSDHRFTMQDIVRDAALAIATKEMQVFSMTKGKLYEWPDIDKLERCTAISLHHCDIIDEFPACLIGPRIREFHIDNNGPRLEIPDNFFEEMRELRVLMLTGFNLSPLPSSITCLTKLRMLCLERCMLREKLCIIGNLKKLRILGLARSDIEELPDELRHLTMLQLLDISNCTKLKVIPPNVISSLTSLEELYMRNTLIQWKVERQVNQSENASLSELMQLDQLTTLDIQIPNADHLSKNLFFDKLDSYKIVIGDFNAFSQDFRVPEIYEASRFLALQLKDGFDIHSQKGIKMLFEGVENLLLGELNDVQDVFYELNLEGFPHLKHLSIINNSHIKYIMNSMDLQHPEKAFPKLESLCLYKLKSMEKICYSQLINGSFGKLKVIKIKLCGQLENVFFFSMVGLLIALETIEVCECNSLKEIVAVETQSNDYKIEFKELRSLMLQSLIEFIGFYTRHPSREEQHRGLTELFDEMVVFPKLERMELSSIQVNKIWSDQPLANPYFENLIHLDVNGCWKLKYLLSFSMATSLVNLQSLFVNKCEMIGYIFIQANNAEMKQCSVCPNLKNIKLTNMKRLKKIWDLKDVSSESFGKLDSLIIEECEKLENVFPSYMVGSFQSLCDLRVTNCKSMEEIFDLKDKKKGDAGDATNLQNVHLEALPELKHVWNNDPEGILKFKNLQSLWVRGCPSLDCIFPVSVAKDLEKLESLVVRDCGRLKEIVAMGAAGTDPSRIPFVFPKLTAITFSELERFYPGRHTLSWPALNSLSVELCDKLEPFKTETETADPETKPVFLPIEVLYNLKSMQIEQHDAKSLRSYIGNYRMHKLEEFHLSRLPDTEILYFFVHRNPNLKSLLLENCPFEELVPHGRLPANENLGVVPKLKSLKLINLPLLKIIGFERDTVLQRIECLIVKECARLITIVPSVVSFTYLTNLEVVNCNGLTSLVAPSTARSLVQLTTMKVIQCKLMKEIVSEQEYDEKNAIEIVFKQLNTLELVSLESLESFCSSESCTFQFPSLQKLVVSGCRSMLKFCDKVKITPSSQQVYVVHENEDQTSYWDGDLNATVQYIFTNKERLILGDYLMMQKIWLKKIPVPNRSFSNVKSLVMEDCKFLSNAILPSHILLFLSNLEELEVQNCDYVISIFDNTNMTSNGPASFLSLPLKILTLKQLPMLKHIWNEDPKGSLNLPQLEEVRVNQCESIQSLFPASVAKDRLKLLEVKKCKGLVDIVAKDESTKKATGELSMFPSLTSLILWRLESLEVIYPGMHNLEMSQLKELNVYHCPKLKVFATEFPNCSDSYPEGQDCFPTEQQGLVSAEKVTPHLEKLSLIKEDAKTIEQGQLNVDLQKIKYLKLRCFHDESDIFPYSFLSKVPLPSVEKLGVGCSNFKEIFPSQRPDMDCTEILSRLKGLELNLLPKLNSIGFGHPWMGRFPRNLETMYVYGCRCLRNLATSTVSFSHLTELAVKYCGRLKYLFTSSTAKSLGLLNKMEITNCGSMEEIVAKEGDEAEDEIIFEQLKTLSLMELPSLVCFYSGNATLQLSSLSKADIWKCPMLRTFSQGSANAESFRGIQVSLVPNDDLLFHNDLNSTVQWMLGQRQEHLILGVYPLLQKIWLKEVPIPDRCFCNLKSLVMEDCKFLSDAILPSHILSFLNNLEELEVRNCDSVISIFDNTNMTSNGPASSLSLPLKILTLNQLTMLKHVWNEDPKESLNLPRLEEVRIDECESIQSLFPASVAKDRLKLLNVRNCKGLVDIVAKDESTEEATRELTMFPHLTSVTLWTLESLECICPGMHNLEWPELKELDVYHCPKLKVFATEIPNCPHSYPEDQHCFPTEQQGLVSAEMVTPNLEQLSLSKEDTKMIEQGQLNVDLQKIKFLKLQCFHDESDIFPSAFLSKVRLPNIEKLEVGCSDLKEVFPSQKPDMDCTEILSRLKGLDLDYLPKLNSIGFEHPWMGPFPGNLETLYVYGCDCLKHLATSTVSFSCLTELTVDNCDGLKYLFTSTTAKSLGLLNKMEITNCESIEEIVAKEGDEPEEDEIKLKHLEILSLKKLPSLVCFYSGNATLHLSSLTKVGVWNCSKMKTFSQGFIDAESFRGIQVSLVPNDDLLFHHDLNSTVQWMLGQRQEHLILGVYPLLQKIWLKEVPVPDRCFCNLKSLVVEDSEFLSDAVLPSHILPFLNNVEELEVQNCGSIISIFDNTNMTSHGPASSLSLPLKKLTLNQLPMLKHIWNEDPKESLNLPQLEEIWIDECESIKSLFPASVAKDRLKLLDVRNCKGLVDIVAKDESTEEATEELTMFPSLTTLTLWTLESLECIYPGMHNLEWPELKELDVYHCPKLKVFATEQDCFPAEQQGLVSAEEVTSHLEKLSLSKEDTKMIEQGQLNVDLQKIKFLRLQCFHDESDIFPYSFLSKVRLASIEKLDVVCSDFKEIFPSQGPDMDFTEILSRLKGLDLNYLPKLNSTGFEHPWMGPFPGNLETMYVYGCHCLKNLATSAVSFSRLTELTIDNSDELKYLFTSSTAKSLGLLNKMEITNCESIEEIVAKEGDEAGDEIKFARLEILSLKELPSLVCFYSGNATLQLSSLTKADIWKCPKLRTFSQGSTNAESFRGIQVSLVPNDDLLFHDDLNCTVQWMLGQRQEHLILGVYPFLQKIWLKEVPVPDRCFCNLKSLVVEDCKFLSDAILPSHILSFLNNLEELEVRNNDSVISIFDNTNMTSNRPASSLSLPLKILTLNQLPMLKHIWNQDPKESLKLPQLEEVWIEECEGIQSLFPASVAKDRLKLLDVRNCKGLVDIVAKDESTEEATRELTMFPSLTSLTLWTLESLECIYPGMHNLEWPELKELDVYHCPKLKVFATEFPNCPDSYPEGQDCFPTEQLGLVSAEKVTPHLEQLSLSKEDTKMIEQDQLNVDLPKIKCLELQCLHDESVIFPSAFLSKVRLPSIEKLRVVCSHFKEIFPSQGPDMDCTEILSRLKGLDLDYLPKLNSIGFEHPWMGPFPENLETLYVYQCDCLKRLATSSVSFSNLTELTVDDCDGLKHLFTSSTARSLGLLNKMEITNCESMEEIVAKEGDEPEEDEIKLKHLEILSLEELPSLVCFYSGNATLQLSSLTKADIWKCPKFRTFSQGSANAESFRGIQVSLVPNDDLLFHRDLNSTVQWMLGQRQERLILDVYPLLQKIWLKEVPVPDRCFCNLKSLVVEDSEFLSDAVLPSHILPFLNNVKELEVRNCGFVISIFDNTNMTSNGPASSLSLPLKKLTLNQLPMLKHIWNEDPKESLNLPHLEEVWIDECESIQSLFPASVAKDRLKLLDVRDCKGLVDIIAKDESTEEATRELTMFPRLTSLTLWTLESLECIYPGLHNLEWPELKELDVYHCPKLKVFATESPDCPDSYPGGQHCFPTEQQGLVSAEMVTPHLEQLSLSKEDTKMIEQGQLHVDLQKIKLLKLQCFHDESDRFPSALLSKVRLPNIEKLEVGCSDIKEVFPSQRPDMDCTEILSRLKGLDLDYLPKLNSIGFEHPWMGPFPGNLETLDVHACDCLTNLAPFTVSFSNLTTLTIDNCDGLKYLFTSSTAKSLGLLNKMEITNCESIEEIVAKEGDERAEDEIKVEHLDILSLRKLPSLVCFYSGNATLHLSSLTKVDIWKCPKMKTFSQGFINAESFRGIQVSLVPNDDLLFHHDLNFTVEWMVVQRQERLILGVYPILQKIWLKEVPVPHRCFSNLRSLVVEDSKFLSDTLLPSHILPFLSNLEGLVVRNCGSVISIFDNANMTSNEPASFLSLPLKILNLKQLPMLKHIWNEDPKGSLSLPQLEEVRVNKCKSIQSLFPTSMAKDSLKLLHVRHCMGLVNIVAKDESTEEATKELTMFPSLTSLTLWTLKSLDCIYPGMHNLEWPQLKELNVYHCPKLKVFATKFPSCPDSYPVSQDCLPTEQQGLVSAEKVTPQLEQLSLSKEETKMIEQDQLHVDLQKIKILKLLCFHDDTDIFPYLFLSKVPLPCIEKLGVFCSDFKEIFPSQRPDVDCTEILSQLKGLDLDYLPKLNSIGFEYPWMGPFPANLKTLYVHACNCLENLAPSTVSFSCLTVLTVDNCDGLKYLFTSSTTKSFGLLSKMYITNCKSIEKIMAKEGDEPAEDEIKLKHLKILSLGNLPELGSFYTGNSTLNFPSLEKVSFTQCHRMEIFCRRYEAPNIRRLEIDKVSGDRDLNTAIQQHFNLRTEAHSPNTCASVRICNM